MLIEGPRFHLGGSAFDWNLPPCEALKRKTPERLSAARSYQFVRRRMVMGELHHASPRQYIIGQS